MLWIGIALSTVPQFDLVHFLDDDGDNVGPRMLVAFWIALGYGVLESLRGRPLAWIKKAGTFWLVACFIIVFMAVL